MSGRIEDIASILEVPFDRALHKALVRKIVTSLVLSGHNCYYLNSTGLRVLDARGNRSAINVSARMAASHSWLLNLCWTLSDLQRDSVDSRAELLRIMALMDCGCLSNALAVDAAQHSTSRPALAGGAVI
ncbi:hypothetical protein [Massilia varians]|uniref:hypothetical protein n=1 Tax=Massilia varians TaxID=457921 RepID=UPI00360F8E17